MGKKGGGVGIAVTSSEAAFRRGASSGDDHRRREYLDAASPAGQLTRAYKPDGRDELEAALELGGEGAGRPGNIMELLRKKGIR